MSERLKIIDSLSEQLVDANKELTRLRSIEQAAREVVKEAFWPDGKSQLLDELRVCGFVEAAEALRKALEK